jgi:hypothetical protein
VANFWTQVYPEQARLFWHTSWKNSQHLGATWNHSNQVM